MVNTNKHKLTLYHPVIYQIKVPGHLDVNWSYWMNDMEIAVDCNIDGQTITTLTGSFDQAALQGFLRRLYSLGLPLISVKWVENMSD